MKLRLAASVPSRYRAARGLSRLRKARPNPRLTAVCHLASPTSAVSHGEVVGAATRWQPPPSRSLEDLDPVWTPGRNQGAGAVSRPWFDHAPSRGVSDGTRTRDRLDHNSEERAPLAAHLAHRSA